MSSVDSLAKDLIKIMHESGENGPKPYDPVATVVKTDENDSDILWVRIPGSDSETPVEKTINANPGDNVRVRVSGGRAWVIGNATNPPTDDTTANQAKDIAYTADKHAISAIKDAARAKDAADSAEASAQSALVSAAEANQAANLAITNLATVESVVDTLQWLSDHSTLTTDISPVEGKNYYVKNPDGTFTKIVDTSGKSPVAEGWYEMDEAVSNYVASHLALTDNGLDLVMDGNHYRIHIGTHPITGQNDGVYILDETGAVVTFFGESIDFSSTRVQHIGNNNAYIIFNPADGGSISIGGASITLGDTRTLDEVVAQMDNTLVYDHTYEYVVTGGKKTGAIFTAFLYRGGVDVKTEYDPTCFSWVLKKEDEDGVHKETSLGTGYTKTVSLADCGYGAEIIGRCEINDDPELLTIDSSNLQDISNNNLSVRAQGESVRVRDLTTSSIIFPNESIMVVGASNEHLVTIQTLQDYLNANLDKQVLFNTTDGWDVQLRPQSEANTIYIYTDHQIDSQGNRIAGIKVGDGNAYVCDLPFIDAIYAEHIANTTIHVTAADRTRWDEKVRCYYAGTEQLIFTTT